MKTLHKVAEGRVNNNNGVSKSTLIVALIGNGVGVGVGVGVGDDNGTDVDVLTLLSEMSTPELSRYTWLLILRSSERPEAISSMLNCYCWPCIKPKHEAIIQLI